MRRFAVVVTVRSEEKGQRILDSHPRTPKEKLSFVIVEDIAKEGAFDETVKSDPPFEYVVHTASPFHFDVQDPIKDLIDPAVKGTTGILKAIRAFAPTVKRIVLTSSFAAIINPKNHPKVYSESVWNPVTLEDAMSPLETYRASKTLAERAAWEFLEQGNPQFDLVTINPPLVFGPVVHHLNSMDAINTSNIRIKNMIQGESKSGLSPTGSYLWADVRDVALAHVRAIEVPEAGRHRFFVVAGYFTNKMIADIIREAYPEKKSILPPEDVADDLPVDVYGYDNKKSIEVLGLQYRTLKETVDDTAKSLLEIGV